MREWNEGWLAECKVRSIYLLVIFLSVFTGPIFQANNHPTCIGVTEIGITKLS